MDSNKPRTEHGANARAKVQGQNAAAAAKRDELIRGMEQAWVKKENETAGANQNTAKPHGLLGKMGLSTATG
jgi:hypothetical protein